MTAPTTDLCLNRIIAHIGSHFISSSEYSLENYLHIKLLCEIQCDVPFILVKRESLLGSGFDTKATNPKKKKNKEIVLSAI